MKGFITIGLLILSNVFMTLAWYGHLKFTDLKWFENAGLITVVLISWGLALFEYFFQQKVNSNMPDVLLIECLHLHIEHFLEL